MATFEEQWDELKREEADVYNSLTPAQRNKLVRRFAQRVARKEVGSGDQRLKDFLSTNLSPIQGMKGGVREEISAFPETALKSFTGYSAIGQAGKGVKDILTGAPVEQQEPIDTRLTGAYQALKAGRIGEAGRNLASYGREKSSYYMPGTLAAGTVGLAADITGQIPDIITGAKLAGTAAQGLMRTGLPQRAAGVLSQGGVDAAMQFAGTLAATRDLEAALRAAGFGGALGSGVGYLAPAAPTAATQRVITERARMRRPASPGLSPNLMPPAAQTMRGGPTGGPFRPIAKPAQVSTQESRRAAQVGLPRPMMAAIESQQGPSVIYRPPGQGPVEINPAWMPGGQPVPNVAAARTMAQESLDMQRRMAAAAPFEQMEGRGPRLLPPPSGEPVMPQVPPRPPAPGEAALYGVAPPNVSDIIRARQEAEVAYNAIRNAPPPDPADPMGFYRAGFEQVALNRLNDLREQEQAAIARTLADAQTREARAAAAATQAQAAQQTEAARLAGPSTIANDPMWDPRVREAMAAALPPRSAFRQAYPTSAEIAARPDPMADPTVQAALRAALPPGSQILGNLPTPSAVRPPAPPAPPMPPIQLPTTNVGQAAPGTPQLVTGAMQAPPVPVPPVIAQGPAQRVAELRARLMQLPPVDYSRGMAFVQQNFPEQMAIMDELAGIMAFESRMSPKPITTGEVQVTPVQQPQMPVAGIVGKTTDDQDLAIKNYQDVKKKDLADTPLGRLMLGEEGAATPAAMLGAVGTLPTAALGVLYRGLRAGGQGLAAVARSPQFGRAAEALQAIPNTTARIGQMVEGAIPPELAAAIAKVRALPVEVASGVENAIANRFPAVGRAMDAALRFTITNYGKPEAYIRLEEAAANAGRQIENNLANFGIRIFDTLGNDAARMARLYDDMTAESYVPGSNTVDDALVMEGRALTADVGRHLVRIGALTPEAFAQWGGRYLPRIYEKVLRQAREDGVTSAFVRFFQDDPTLAGYYHRGLRETVSQAEAARRIASGQWQELSRTGTGKVVVWRDWTAAERAKWGELKNVSASLEKYAGAARREIQNGTFLEGIRTGSDSAGAWALDANSLFPGQPKTMRPADFTDAAGNRYIYIGDTARKGGAIKKFGTLSDHYVRDDINAHLMFTHELGSFKQGVRIAKKISGVNWWKKLVTIGSPTYFANNFFVNMPMLELSGGSIADIPKAVNMIAAGDPLIADLASRGLIQDGLALRQLAQRTNPIIERAAGSTSPAGIAGAISRAGAALKRYEAGAYNVAGASDDIFRVALVKALRDRHKMSIDDAVEVANTAFYNREKVKAPIVDMLEPIIPFAAVTHWSMSSLPKLMWQNPVKAAYLGTLAAALPYVAETFYGVKPEKARAMQELLPQQMRPGLGLGFPNSVLTGYDDKGQPVYVDLASFNPVSMFTAEVPVGPSQAWPRALSPGGPATIVAQLVSNKDWYTGKKLVELDERGRRQVIDDTLLSQIPGVGELAPTEVRQFLGRALIPGVVRMPFEAARAAAAQAVSPETAVSLGLTSGQSVPISLGTRVARMAGLKARPLNPQEMFARELGIEETSLAGIRKSQGAALRRYERAVQAGNDAEAADALQKWTAYETMKQSVMMQESERQQRLAPALE